MTTADQTGTPPRQHRGLVPLLIATSLAFAWILLPFYGAILWGAIIALLFAPLYRRLLPQLGQRRNLAALLTLLVVLIIVILPLSLVAAALVHEATLVVQRIGAGEINPGRYLHGVFDALPESITSLLHRVGLGDFESLQQRISSAFAQGGRFMATQALGIGQNTFDFIARLCIALYLAFFLMRDGDAVARAVRRAIPLASAHKQQLFDKFNTVIRATVKGSLLVAAVQGTLGGIAFWALGVGGALLWAVLMALLSLLPVIGSALVWLPVALYFVATGALWKGFGLIAYGLLVIGLIDNLLRPMLVGKETHIPDYVVMIATLGGLAVFGIHGFVLGPTIAAMFIAVWHLYGTTRDAEAGSTA